MLECRKTHPISSSHLLLVLEREVPSQRPKEEIEPVLLLEVNGEARGVAGPNKGVATARGKGRNISRKVMVGDAIG